MGIGIFKRKPIEQTQTTSIVPEPETIETDGEEFSVEPEDQEQEEQEEEQEEETKEEVKQEVKQVQTQKSSPGKKNEVKSVQTQSQQQSTVEVPDDLLIRAIQELSNRLSVIESRLFRAGI